MEGVREQVLVQEVYGLWDVIKVRCDGGVCDDGCWVHDKQGIEATEDARWYEIHVSCAWWGLEDRQGISVYGKCDT